MKTESVRCPVLERHMGGTSSVQPAPTIRGRSWVVGQGLPACAQAFVWRLRAYTSPNMSQGCGLTQSGYARFMAW